MDREDSGVIDLFAIHERAKAAPSEDAIPRDLFSSPPPAFTTDLYSDPGQLPPDPDDGDSPFGKKASKRLILGGAGAALLVVVIMIVAFSGGSSDTAKASAGGKSEAAPTAPAVVVPSTVQSAVATNTPPPPTTGAPAAQKPVPRAGGRAAPANAKARPPVASGPKLTKIQSGGVASK